MRRWTVPTIYTVASLLAAFILPRLEDSLLPGYEHGMSVSSATAFLSAVSSGIMAFTAIVVSITFVIVQFSTVAYSPRLVIWFANRPQLYHALGIFIATFTYAMATLLWTDRHGSGSVPFFSTMLVLVLLSASMLIFSRLVQSLSQLQITEVLRLIGDEGRRVIAAQQETFDHHRANRVAGPGEGRLPGARPPQALLYAGAPCSVTSVDVPALLRLARGHDAVFVVTAAVGDTVMQGSTLLLAETAGPPVPEADLRRAIRLGRERTFEQDPKYAVRLLVDIAIRALSPAINDPTTAVQAMDQIEDLLRHLGRQELGSLWLGDGQGRSRVFLPMPTWNDYLSLAFDETRQFGMQSMQLVRRLGAALDSLQTVVADPDKRAAVKRYRSHLDRMIRHSEFDTLDRLAARQADPQGLGLTRVAPRREAGSRKRHPDRPSAGAPDAVEAAPKTATGAEETK